LNKLAITLDFFMTSSQRSLDIPGAGHKAPISLSTQVGPLIYSSGISGKNPAMGPIPADPSLQLRKAFDNMDALLAVGIDHFLFGTEKPGTGNSRNPISGRDCEDMKPVIENIGWLTEAQKADLFKCNHRRVDSKAFSTTEQC